MRYTVTGILLLASFIMRGQATYSGDEIPVFKQVTHPFMPPITSEYFFFSEDGLLWFSTAQGLTSFDGSEVTYYSSLQQANNFLLNRIMAITEDKKHNFYIGTPIGLYYYDRKTGLFTTLSYNFSDTHKSVNITFEALCYENNGLLYIGSGSQGLFIFNEQDRQFSHYNLDSSKPDSWIDRRLNTVSCLANHATDSTKLWVGTFHGIYLFDKKNKTFERRFELINPGKPFPGAVTYIHLDIQKMDVENDSTIWFNSWTGGFGKYNTHTGKAKLFLYDALFKSPERTIGYIIPKFAKLSPGKYLIGIYNGKTAVFDTRTETVKYFTVTTSGFPEEQTRFVTNDRNGNLWLLQRGLLYTVIPASLRLQAINLPDQVLRKMIKPILRGIYFDTASHLYYCTFTGSVGVATFDSDFHQRTILPTSLVNEYFLSKGSNDKNIVKDGSGRFWTAGIQNHVLFPGEKKFEPVIKKITSLGWLKDKGEFKDLLVDRQGNILLQKNEALIYQIDHQTFRIDTLRCPVIKPDKGIQIGEVSAWYDNKRDIIYMARSEGIAQYHKGTRKMKVVPSFSLFGSLPPYQGNCTFTLDPTGRIWFMIPRYGIRMVDPGSLLCIDSIPFGTKGFMRGDYTDMLGGENNYMLFRSQNGIIVYDVVKKQSFLFDRSNGLSSPDNQALLYSNGHMIVSQNFRVEYFKLSNLDNYSSTIRPYLNSIVTDTTSVFTRTGLEKNLVIPLRHYQNSFTLSFSAPEFIFPERVEYAYQLKPLSNEWHFTNYFNRKITFNNLPTGKYIFRLKAQMQGGNWTAEPIEYIIIITPAWWQTGLFRLLCIIVAVVLAYYVMRRRIQFIRIKEQQKSAREKEMLELEAKALRAQMNPHFIFNCMNSIKSLIQQHEEEKAVTYLTTFSKLIRTLFNNADKKEISLYDEIETCKYYLQLEAMRFDTKFAYGVNIDNNIDLKSVQVPALIIQPFIENAIWHGIVPKGTGGQVLLAISGRNGSVEIVVEDDGVGREASQQNRSTSNISHQSKGVNLTQSRLELDNLLQQRQATLETIDKKNEDGMATGTKVIITIKEEI